MRAPLRQPLASAGVTAVKANMIAEHVIIARIFAPKLAVVMMTSESIRGLSEPHLTGFHSKTLAAADIAMEQFLFKIIKPMRDRDRCSGCVGEIVPAPIPNGRARLFGSLMG
jgi:hypothetical protein